VSAREDNFMIS